MGLLGEEQWSPYLVGAGIGILTWLTFLLSDKPLACSTSFARTGGMIERLFRGNSVLAKKYFEKFKPEVDWQVILVLGVVIGAFTSAIISGTFAFEVTTPKWVETFGDDVSLRLIIALIGGMIIGIGARWAGGCTSGHGISGTLQLALSSWIAAICFFTGGIAVAMLMYGVF